MKKILIFISLILSTLEISAQETATTSGDVWGRNKTTTSIGWVNQDFAPEGGTVNDSKFGFMLRVNKTYNLHKKPIAKILKIGIDAVFTDITVSKYDTENSSSYSENWNTLVTDDGYSASDILGNIGLWNLNYSLGVGLAVTVAPFANLQSGVRFLKVKLYSHYKPTASTIILSDDNETESKFAFANMVDFGGMINYKGISIGMDGSWGSGKFKSLLDLSGTDEKIKYKFAATRFFISIAF
jgi:hypothetical protein